MPLKESENSAKKEEEEEKAENEIEQDGVDQGEAVDGRRDEEEGHNQEEHREPLVLFNLLSKGGNGEQVFLFIDLAPFSQRPWPQRGASA